jgi:hypothetical protein
MNNKLLEMILAQSCGAGRPGMADLMARLGSASGGGSLDPKELLSRLGNSNPAVASLLQQMTAQQQQAAAAPVEVIDVETTPAQGAPHEAAATSGSDEIVETAAEPCDDDSARELQELQRRADLMCKELKLLRERNDLFAAAVGACCLCWGQDLNCRSCRGRGGPGFCIPDEELFEDYVVPAIHTFRAQKAKVQSLASAAPRRSVEAETPLRSVANYSA